MDGKIASIIGVSFPQVLTRNETIIPSSFLVWGNDYTTDKYIKNSGKLTINGNTTNNVIQIENSTGNFQFNQEGANFVIRDNTGNAVLQMDNSTRLVNVFNNLTISGTLQSFQTSLLATSHTNLQNQVNNLNNATLGTSINNNTTSINNLNVSSSVMDGKIGTD